MAKQSRTEGSGSGGVSRLFSTDLARDLEFLTARARAVGTLHANAGLEPLGLKVRSYAVLVLACSGENPSQRELAEFLSLDASQIVALVDQLEKSGFVMRQSDSNDRRSNIIVSTESGRTLCAKANAAVAEAHDLSLRALTHAEREQLRQLLVRIAFDMNNA
ncbi:MAG: MarR family transcriptional regulator [Actinomycetales bacterium]|nr:MarR family transcriptional regulator [Actinomycetales bacterium]